MVVPEVTETNPGFRGGTMKLLTISLMVGTAVFWLSACSEKEKEAAKLEQEVKNMETADSAVLDSLTPGHGGSASTRPLTDTSKLTSQDTVTPTADPAAIPPEMRPSRQSAVSAETTPKAPMPPIPSGGGFTVQIASSESQDYARRLVETYTGRGYQPFVSTITYNNQTYYRVRVGNFQTVAEAKALKEELADRYSIKPWIDRIE